MAERFQPSNVAAGTFGVSNFEYGVLNSNDLVTKTRQIQGLNKASVQMTYDQTTLNADDSPYAIISGGITEVKETINLYDYDSEMRKDLYGIEVKKGVEVYDKNITPNNVATLFKSKISTGESVWFALLKGQFKLPEVSVESTNGAPNVEAPSVEGTFISRGDQQQIVMIGRTDNPEFDFDTFYKAVFPKTEDDAHILDNKNVTKINADQSK